MTSYFLSDLDEKYIEGAIIIIIIIIIIFISFI